MTPDQSSGSTQTPRTASALLNVHLLRSTSAVPSEDLRIRRVLRALLGTALARPCVVTHPFCVPNPRPQRRTRWRCRIDSADFRSRPQLCSRCHAVPNGRAEPQSRGAAASSPSYGATSRDGAHPDSDGRRCRAIPRAACRAGRADQGSSCHPRHWRDQGAGSRVAVVHPKSGRSTWT